MKLLMLIPNLILLAISGYNLLNEFTTEGPNYLAFKVLHLLVMAMCITFITLIVKSMFVIKYVEMPETEAVEEETAYEEMELQHF